MSYEAFQPSGETAIPIHHQPESDYGFVHRYVFGSNDAELTLATFWPGEVYIHDVRATGATEEGYQPRGFGTFAIAFACTVAERAERPIISAALLNPRTLHIMRKLLGDGALSFYQFTDGPDGRPVPVPLDISSQDVEEQLKVKYDNRSKIIYEDSSEAVYVQANLQRVPENRRAAIRRFVETGSSQPRPGDTSTSSVPGNPGASSGESMVIQMRRTIAKALEYGGTADQGIAAAIEAVETTRGLLEPAFQGSSQESARIALEGINKALEKLTEARTALQRSAQEAGEYSAEL